MRDLARNLFWNLSWNLARDLALDDNKSLMTLIRIYVDKMHKTLTLNAEPGLEPSAGSGVGPGWRKA